MTTSEPGAARWATSPADPATAAMEAARELAPEIPREAESLCTLPPDLAERIERAGLFALWLPRSLGGLELDPVTIVRVIEELSYADGSAGWPTLIRMSTAFFAWLEPAVARELIDGRPYAASTCVVASTGQAVPDGTGGFTVAGRWAFSSGIRHARFSQVGAVVMDGADPRMLDDGTPDWRLAFFATERGPMRSEPCHDGPLWRFPLFANLNVTIMGFPLGVARRALDEFIELACTKTRGPGRARLADDRHVQLQLSITDGGLQAARAFASRLSVSCGTPRAQAIR